jgi:hypothetical protein
LPGSRHKQLKPGPALGFFVAFKKEKWCLSAKVGQVGANIWQGGCNVPNLPSVAVCAPKK